MAQNRSRIILCHSRMEKGALRGASHHEYVSGFGLGFVCFFASVFPLVLVIVVRKWGGAPPCRYTRPHLYEVGLVLPVSTVRGCVSEFVNALAGFAGFTIQFFPHDLGQIFGK